ncbi:MAG: hypothetical protein KDA61_17945 [Planctomycetales bacterium]|nr:hypothetical protein [Planctomycetales bacterium]
MSNMFFRRTLEIHFKPVTTVRAILLIAGWLGLFTAQGFAQETIYHYHGSGTTHAFMDVGGSFGENTMQPIGTAATDISAALGYYDVAFGSLGISAPELSLTRTANVAGIDFSLSLQFAPLTLTASDVGPLALVFEPSGYVAVTPPSVGSQALPETLTLSGSFQLAGPSELIAGDFSLLVAAGGSDERFPVYKVNIAAYPDSIDLVERTLGVAYRPIDGATLISATVDGVPLEFRINGLLFGSDEDPLTTRLVEVPEPSSTLLCLGALTCIKRRRS